MIGTIDPFGAFMAMANEKLLFVFSVLVHCLSVVSVLCWPSQHTQRRQTVLVCILLLTNLKRLREVRFRINSASEYDVPLLARTDALCSF